MSENRGSVTLSPVSIPAHPTLLARPAPVAEALIVATDATWTRWASPAVPSLRGGDHG